MVPQVLVVFFLRRRLSGHFQLLRIILSRRLLAVTIHHARLEMAEAHAIVANRTEILRRLDEITRHIADLSWSARSNRERLRIACRHVNTHLSSSAKLLTTRELADCLKRERLPVHILRICYIYYHSRLLRAVWNRIKPTGTGVSIADELDVLIHDEVPCDDFILHSSPLTDALSEADAEFTISDSATQVMYLDRLSEMASSCHVSEDEIMNAIVIRLRQRVMDLAPGATPSVAAYLFGDNSPELLSQLGGTMAKKRWLQSVHNYVLLNAILTVATCGLALFVAMTSSTHRLAFVVVVGVMVPAVSDFWNRTVDLWVYLICGVRRLPRVQCADGMIPDRGKTIIAVPTVLSSEGHVRALLDLCERNYLITLDANVKIAVLSDWPESVTGPPSHDEKRVLEDCAARMTELNNKYGVGLGSPFILLHRGRQWIPSEGRWIGSDRKRGKLLMLNEMLLGRQAPFEVHAGSIEDLVGVSYVLVIDDNTVLIENGVAKLVGTAIHSYNRGYQNGYSSVGYSVFQPFPCVIDASARAWGHAHVILESLCNPEQPPSFVRNPQFDWFGQSAFYGKGLYHVASFSRAIRGKLPDNRLISHDIIEGGMAKTAYVGDVIFPEEAPRNLREYYLRAHRWARGDWQNLLLLALAWLGCDRSVEEVDAFAHYTVAHFCRRTLIPMIGLMMVLIGAMISNAGVAIVIWIGMRLLPDYMFAISTVIKGCIDGVVWLDGINVSKAVVGNPYSPLVDDYSVTSTGIYFGGCGCSGHISHHFEAAPS